MSDSWRNELITKGAAFDVLTEVESHYEFEDGHDHLMRWAKTKIFALPSSQPHDIARDIATIIENEKDMRVMLKTAKPKRTETHDWIPVTERLPEVGQWVLCQCRAGIIDVLRLTDDDCWYRKSNEIYMSGFVLAWMPLPEPYKGEKE